jgi:hypothetical protein
MRYFDSPLDAYVYQFENVYISIEENVYFPYTLPVNFFQQEYQLLVDGDSYDLVSYSLSVAVPPNGIINDSQDNNRVIFNIEKNYHHYLQILLTVGEPPN